MKKKMIIIGSNGSAYKRTIPALKDSEVCEVVAIQSRNEEKLKQIAKEYEIQNCYTDISEMLEKEEYDFIFIANPPFVHEQTIRQCTLYKKPIICEKPLSRDYKEGLQIKEILENEQIPFMVAHQIRHQKAYKDIKEIIASGKIGEVLSVWVQWGYEINEQSSNALWKLDKELGGGGTFSDNGIHALDLIIGLFGEPKNVTGNSRIGNFRETYSNEIMVLSYEDKDVIVNSSHTMKSPGNHLLIYGTTGRLEAFSAIGEKATTSIKITTNQEEELIYEEENLYKNEIENFVKHYLLKEENVEKGTSLEEGLIALKLIDQLRERSIIKE